MFDLISKHATKESWHQLAGNQIDSKNKIGKK